MENIYFTSYEGAVEALLRAKNRDAGKPVHNNTRVLQVDEESVGLKLHDTTIVYYYPDGRIRLDTGGWKTLTTKDRINAYTPFRVWSENHIWKIQLWFRGDRGETYNYKDGMVIHPNGKVNGAMTEKEIDVTLKNKKLINTYVTKFGNALPVEQPGGGDCWFCSFTTDDGKTMGDTSGNHEHLWSHIKENYFVPSLLYNTMKEAGYNDFAVGIYGVFKDTSNYTSKDVAKRALRRYLHKRLL